MTTPNSKLGTQNSDLPRRLGLFDALSIVIGVVIGAGIFLVPNSVAQQLPSTRWILAVWVFAGVISFFGALACAELGAMLPLTGGQYVYLREAWGPLIGFLCGWSMFTVARTAQVAWLGLMLAVFGSYFLPLSPLAAKLVGIGSIAIFTAINYRGVTMGAAVQKAFTSAKVAGLLIIIGSAFLLGGRAPHAPNPPAGPISLSSLGVALIACLLAYDGWVQISFVAGEVRNPSRNIPLALALGSGVVIAIYLMANLAYMRVLSIAEIAESLHVGADATERVLGTQGGGIVALIILLSIIGTMNGCFLTSPRVYFAQARDGLFLQKFGEVHPQYQTPGFAILAQGAWSAILLATGGAEALMDYAMFAMWLSYIVMVAGVIALRRTRPDLPRPYRMTGYPVTPILFLLVATWFLLNMIVTRPIPSLAALALIATGVPVFFVYKRRQRAASIVA